MSKKTTYTFSMDINSNGKHTHHAYVNDDLQHGCDIAIAHINSIDGKLAKEMGVKKLAAVVEGKTKIEKATAFYVETRDANTELVIEPATKA